MKLFIIGAAGSGKTTLAHRISESINIVAVNLDDLFWNNSLDGYGNRRDEGERTALLDEVLQNESWIIEGAYVEWPMRAMKEADRIIYLKTPKRTVNYRIWKRFIRRKIGLERQVKKETFRGVRELVIWNARQIEAIDALMTRMKEEKTITIIEKIRDSRELEKDIAAIQR